MSKYKKRGGAPVTMGYVEGIEKHYANTLQLLPPKYIQFIRKSLEHGFAVNLYDCPKTVSKYVTVQSLDKSFKVRFSNHKPNKTKELRGDCDYFVGVTHTGVRTTDMAWDTMLKTFGIQHEQA